MPELSERVSHDPAFSAYMRDVGRHALLTPEQERQLAIEFVELRVNFWRQLISYAPYTANVLEFTQSVVEDIDGHHELLSSASVAARATRDTNRRAAADEFSAAIDAVARVLSELDPQCVAADRVVAELELLASGQSHGLSLDVRPPRRGSRPFADYVGRVRRASAAMRCVRNQFARANLRLVVRIASRFQRSGLTLHDRVQEGNLGLMKAIDRFDPYKGFRFSTYASWWIKHNIRRAVVNRDRVVRLPAHVQATAQKIAKGRARLRQRLTHEPSAHEIAEELSLPLEKVQITVEALSLTPVSLDASAGGGDARSIADTLFDGEKPTPDDRIETEQDVRRVRGSMLELAPMERDILRQRFGLDGEEPRTLTEIGKQYSLSRERIRQLQQQALRRLRGHLEPTPA